MPHVNALRRHHSTILFELSVPLLVDLLPLLSSPAALQLEQLVQVGRQPGLLNVPQVELSCCQPTPPDLSRLQPGRAPTTSRKRD
jgi:hypothetical protein